MAVALAAGGPVAGQVPRDDDFPLPTDALFSPAPPVPPRTAYQPGPDLNLPPGELIPVPQGRDRAYRFTRRYGTPNTLTSELLPDGVRRFVFTGGVIVNVTGEGGAEVEFATDDAVVWVRGLAVDNIGNGFRTAGGRTEVEVYLAGNVVVRTRASDGTPQTVRAAQVYYDVERSRAVALAATLEFRPGPAPDPLRLRGGEVRRLDPENWEVLGATFDSSKLPSDPGLLLEARRATLSTRRVQLRNIFGLPYRDLRTGEYVEGDEQLVTAFGAVPRVAGVPLFYLPRVRTDATDPLGPFVGFSGGQNRIFGTQVYTTFDLFDLLAVKPPPGQKWRLNADYLSERGPALGTDYTYNLPPAGPGLAGTAGLVKLYGIKDRSGVDILGGFRGVEPVPPEYRGRALLRHQQEFLDGLSFQGQAAYLSDKNFFEQYYKQEFDLGPNQETFAYLSGQRGNLGLAGLLSYRLDRPWEPQTQWLPRVDGYAIGQTFLDDRLVYSASANAGYARARTAEQPPFPVLTTDRSVDTARFDVLQELSVPFALGPVKVVPYGTVDLAAYTEDLTGDAVGRVWGGGGARATLPASRLYEGVASDLLNVRGLYHKAVFGANYLYARTNTPFTELPLLDRLNDDATDRAFRNIVPFQPQLVPGPDGVRLATAGDPTSLFNPQRYLVRRGVTTRRDTLDDINVLQLDTRHRFQTKRGYPGLEHTVDLATVAASVSFFPEPGRDNFGNPFAFLEYDAVYNVGDRTALVTSGWVDPFDGGVRYYSVGAFLNRPDRTSFYAGYRHTDPLNSRAVSGSVGYQLSRRYFLAAGVSYDFGINQALSNSFTLTRTGTDLTVSLGVTYNALVNNLGVQFLVTPNLVAALAPGRITGTQLQGAGGRGR
ncbi:MAG: hypothetical protein C0501_07595 [Isosphaera sp.]|nr:hypothetical protein [Isosphaera sp.]